MTYRIRIHDKWKEITEKPTVPSVFADEIRKRDIRCIVLGVFCSPLDLLIDFFCDLSFGLQLYEVFQACGVVERLNAVEAWDGELFDRSRKALACVSHSRVLNASQKLQVLLLENKLRYNNLDDRTKRQVLLLIECIL